MTEQGSALTFDGENGVVVRVGLKVRSGRVEFPWIGVSAPGGVGDDLLRVVPVGTLRRKAHRRLTGNSGALLDGRAVLAGLYRGSGVEVPEYLAALERAAKGAIEDLRAGPTEGRLRKVAIGYIDAVGIDPRRPVAVLAKKIMKAESTVSGYVAEARKAGWLAPTTPGRITAEPGPRLLEWWKNEGIER